MCGGEAMRGHLVTVLGAAAAVIVGGCGGDNPGGVGTAMDFAVASAPDLGPIENDGGGFNAVCAPPRGVTSVCNDPKSIVRLVARLGVGVDAAEGELVINMNHYRLGDGINGGVAHVSTSKPSVALGPGKMAQVDFDMCAGGDMWSEENCEFWLWGFIDTNGNGELDAGEPA